jgi:hypothetical protein
VLPATNPSLKGMPFVKSMALFWAKALGEVQTVMIPAKIRPRFSIGEYSFFIVQSPVFVN